MMFISPLWPAFGEAITRRDFSWVHTTLRRCYKLILVVCFPLIAGITLMGPWLISIWVGPRLVPERSLLALLGIWFLARVWRETHTMLLNGSGHILGQATYGTASAICGLFLAGMLGRHFQLNGLIFGWLLGFLILNAWLFPAEVWRFLASNATGASTRRATERFQGI
jgi:O-antigen/teichoic acid export membrane protein